MPEHHQREQIKEQIDANSLGIYTGGGLLLFACWICEWGPLPLLSAILGVAVCGRMIMRPQARPPSWIPRAPGFAAEIAQDEAFLDTIQPPHWSQVRYTIISELILLILLVLVSSSTRPWWPARELGAVLVMVFIAFLAGGLITMSTCWMQVYRALLRMEEQR